MKGRKPIPAGIARLKGNPGKRPINDGPTYRDELPACPEHLDTEARAEWDRITEEIRQVPGVCRRVDRAALAGYCMAWSRWVQAELAIAKDGAVVMDRYKQQKKSPWVLIAADAVRRVLAFGVEFGFTPSSRARIPYTPGESPQEDEFEAGLRIKRG